MTYSLYVVRCSDGTLYTGIAKDVAARIRIHNGEGKGGAKYTRSRRPVALVYTKRCKDRGAAQKREYAFKQLAKGEKERLIQGRNTTRHRRVV